MTRVEVATLRTMWVTVVLDITHWDKEYQNDEAYVDAATDELLDVIQVAHANSPNVWLDLESLDHTEIVVLPQN